MKELQQGIIIVETIPSEDYVLEKLELLAKVCYQSKHTIKEGSAKPFVQKFVINAKHLGILEHYSHTLIIRTDIGIGRETLRHRLASFLNESTRYCCYDKDKFDGEISCIPPKSFCSDYKYANFEELKREWTLAMEDAEKHYLKLRELGAMPDDARGVLPLNLKSDLAITTNLRNWIHIINQRMSPHCHEMIRDIMTQAYAYFNKNIPTIMSLVNTYDIGEEKLNEYTELEY